MNAQAPTPPEPHECCGNGCEPCVWDIYREALRKWQEAQAQQALSTRPEDHAATSDY